MASIPEHAPAGQGQSKSSLKRARKRISKTEDQLADQWDVKQTRLYNSFLRLAYKTYVRIPCDYYGSWNGMWTPPEPAQYFADWHQYELVMPHVTDRESQRAQQRSTYEAAFRDQIATKKAKDDAKAIQGLCKQFKEPSNIEGIEELPTLQQHYVMVIASTLSHFKVSDVMCDPFPSLRLPTDWFEGDDFAMQIANSIHWREMFVRPDNRVSFRRGMMWLCERRPVEPFKGIAVPRPTWADDYAAVCKWYYHDEWHDAGHRKSVSHLGAHFSDWAHTEATTRGVLRCTSYRVVYNGWYVEMYNKYKAHLDLACLQRGIDISNLPERSDGQIGDTFEMV
jgi:hypothetical protein